MERNELLNWAIKGLENKIIELDTQNTYDKRSLTLNEAAIIPGYDRELLSKISNRLKDNITLKGQLERKLFDLKFERDLNE